MISLGNIDIKNISLGSNEIKKISLGTTTVWEGIYVAQDSDFSGTTNGSFKYIGTKLEVKIPHIIKGVAVTSYSNMFGGTNVTKVVSDNPNITDMGGMFSYSKATTLDLSSFNTSNVTTMYSMFYNSAATTLDLSSFDTSNVTDMLSMFQISQATTGYARTQTDANKFNASPGKPAGLNFVVKP